MGVRKVRFPLQKFNNILDGCRYIPSPRLRMGNTSFIYSASVSVNQRQKSPAGTTDNARHL
jgi:hypothetical protein